MENGQSHVVQTQTDDSLQLTTSGVIYETDVGF